MKTLKNIKYIGLIAIAVSFTACNDETDFEKFLDQPPVVSEPLPALSAGSADFSNYVSIGASFTAGYTDGALFKAAQENSFPNTLSKQFSKVGGGDFSQPLMNDNIGGLVFGATVLANPRLFFNGSGPQVLQAVPTTDITVSLAADGSIFENVGIPGAKSTHIDFNGYATANPYFGRMANSPTVSMLEYAIAQTPTFFSLSEIGGNDVLGYATTGGDDTDPITPEATFDFVFNDMVNQLTAVCPNGVVTNVPYITSLPHFTTVTHNIIPLDAATAGFLNSASAYGAYNAGIQGAFAFLVANNAISQADADLEIAKRTIVFAEGEGNAVVIMDESLTDLTGINAQLVSMRQATAEDLIVLPAASFIGTEAVPGNPTTVNGVGIPLADKWVLIPSEQENIKTATDAYNITIANVAASKGLAFVDLNAILVESSSTGIVFDNYNLTTDLVTGGLVSLDGIHLTARGYALMANKFLEAIDLTYGSNFVASGNVSSAEDFGVTYSPTLQ
ncbi:SGNH/GDSL hydrolase family protein [Aurantibacter sp.]|uniref:SGNH/GDSL hydrolase family protein n=1 Tax=Aurantibacter sp. TaxID=2807103 RepID=UPI0035C7F01E